MLLGAALTGSQVLDAVQAQTPAAVARRGDEVATLQLLGFLRDEGAHKLGAVVHLRHGGAALGRVAAAAGAARGYGEAVLRLRGVRRGDGGRDGQHADGGQGGYGLRPGGRYRGGRGCGEELLQEVRVEVVGSARGGQSRRRDAAGRLVSLAILSVASSRQLVFALSDAMMQDARSGRHFIGLFVQDGRPRLEDIQSR